MENIATEKGPHDYSFIIQLNLMNKLKSITFLSYTKTDFKEFVHIFFVLLQMVLYKLLVPDPNENKSSCTVYNQYGSGHFGGARGNE